MDKRSPRRCLTEKVDTLAFVLDVHASTVWAMVLRILCNHTRVTEYLAKSNLPISMEIFLVDVRMNVPSLFEACLIVHFAHREMIAFMPIFRHFCNLIPTFADTENVSLINRDFVINVNDNSELEDEHWEHLKLLLERIGKTQDRQLIDEFREKLYQWDDMYQEMVLLRFAIKGS